MRTGRQTVADRIVVNVVQAGLEPGLGERLFDPAPSFGIRSIILGQSPEGVKMIWKENHRINLERPLATALFKTGTENLTRIGFAKERLPIICNDGEEKCTAGGMGTTILSHWCGW